ncbi:MAG: hypothetical protein MPJ78_20415, partial [Hyphomicrobiaceae bacterium]|nr:hypothetical protein [Hyphomicrobiaceae bacterium]
MAIMVAGGMTIAFPGATPDAMAEPRKLANLGVSTTMFGGPMVVEIIVQDPNLDDTGIDQGEPDVTFDGKNLRMVQGDDGYWYAYVANADMLAAADHNLGNDPGTGMAFGTVCDDGTSDAIFPGRSFDTSITVYTTNATCGTNNDISVPTMNVLRVAKTPSTPGGTATDPGENIGNNRMASLAYWPFIQAFDDISDDSSIKVIYNKGGSPQEIVIRYESDMDDLASFDVDRSKYPHSAHVHVDINDNLLNIDPTDIDVWTFDANTVAADSDNVYYHLFDSAGTLQIPAANVDNLRVTSVARGATDFDTSGVLIFDRNDLNTDPAPTATNYVLRVHDNDNGDTAVGTAMNLVTFKESGKNTGLFENTDGNSAAGLVTGPEGTGNDGIGRENPFAITYADTAKNWFVGYSTAVLNMDAAAVGSDWGSGEELPVSVTDQDLNKNSLVTDYVPVGIFVDPLLSIHLGADDADGVIP